MDQLAVPAQPRPAGVFYHGAWRPLAKLLVKGWLLTVVTLGIYRFWLVTNARRYLWSHTDVAGDQLEYTGRGKELLIGFLMALAIFVPLNLVVSLAALGGTEMQAIATLAYIAALALLVPFALYRGRRYRLNRTVHRGIRLGMGGSGIVYALRSIGWLLLTLITFGFAYPWMHASLERYAVGNTYYGDSRAFFSATGSRLWRATLLLQIIVWGPLVAALISLLASGSISLLLADGAGSLAEKLEAGDIATGLGFIIFGVSWMIPAALFLYPVYRAVEMRWWASGISLDELSMRSTLRAGQIYVMYLKFWGAMLLAGLVIGTVTTGVGLFVAGGAGLQDIEALAQHEASIAVTIASVLVYVAFAIVYAVLYYTLVWAGFWRAAATSFTIVNPHVLERAKSSRLTANAFGEGMADALDIGGF